MALSFVWLLAISANSAEFHLHDVSILFPIAETVALQRLWRPDFSGFKGELLPASARELLPDLIDLRENDEVLRSLRAVSLRLDPCFDSPCRRQIRLVWQPLLVDHEGGRPITLDAAVHTFYDLNEDQWRAFIAKYRRLLQGGDGRSGPLNVHPRLKSEGLAGPFMDQLTDLMPSYIGAGNLTRVTFMSLAGTGNVWSFGGFDWRNDKGIPMTIPRVEVQGQNFVNSAKPRLYFENASMVPAPTGADTLATILRDSRHLSSAEEDAVVAEARIIMKMENPRVHSPRTLDCVSCHVAQSARAYAETRYPWRMRDFHHSPERYMSGSHNLSNISPVKQVTGNLRAFGYFVDQPAISQRTINESAEVAEQLNKAAAN